MSDISCAHLDQVTDAINNYNIVLAFYVTCVAKDACKKKAADAHCKICQSSNRRIHACLECAFFGCFDDKCHMKDHALTNKHYVAINLNHGSLFCFKCDDYIYNETFEDIFKDYKLEARRIDGSHFYLPWKPKKEEIGLLQNKIGKISDSSYIGLRGLVNIGNSCYVNCIIQVFMHIPVLRDFFFADKHECFLKGFCLLCEMFVLFQEFYSGRPIPYDLSKRFFAVLQKFCKSDLGIQQQDTFLLFQEILIGLHKSCQKTDETETDNCTCMIHDIFYGVNQIYKRCSCEASSDLPVDHFIDILINLDSKEDSLVSILDRKFLEPQLLSDHTCSECKETGTTYLNQSIKKLPTVICFRMNCFNWKSETKTKRKKSTAFPFEEWIDMSPYLNSKEDIKLSNRYHTSNSYAGENRYRLFAVISHQGNLEGGHYSTYVRQRNRWFECNDILIYNRKLDDVLNSEPFLLFYYNQK